MRSQRKPLAGARVAITRSRERAGPLIGLLEELGADAFAFPVTRICGPEPPAADALSAALARVADGHYDWVVLSSANAAQRLVAALRASGVGTDALTGARLACVGPATADALAGTGLAASLVAERSDALGLGHAVIAAAGDEISSARVLLPRAAGGRQEAAKALRDAGAEVDSVTLYRSCTADPEAPEVERGIASFRNREVEIVAFFAPSQVDAAFELFGADAEQLIGACRVVAAIGDTTRAALAERGIADAVVPRSPAPTELASTIVMEYAEVSSASLDSSSRER